MCNYDHTRQIKDIQAAWVDMFSALEHDNYDPEVEAFFQTNRITTLSQLNKLRAMLDLRPLTHAEVNYLGYIFPLTKEDVPCQKRV